MTGATVLVYPHDLGIGGSQLNAIEIAAAVRDLGHAVIVAAQRGRLVERIEELGLEFVDLPAPHRRPSPVVVAALTALVRRRGVDIVHGYEWPPVLESVLAARRCRDVVPVATVMSMSVAPFIPSSVPVIVGTEAIRRAETAGRTRVTLLEPPVDLDHNDPGDRSRGLALRRGLGVGDHEIVVSMITRLAPELKLEGILTAVDVVAELATRYPLRLMIMGGGPATDEVADRARLANARAGRDVVLLTGEVGDPRPGYEAAEISLGMGGSALRALAYAIPLVVQGEHGFWQVFDDESLPRFLDAGWYGHGAGAHEGPVRLREALTGLLEDPLRRQRLGCLGRTLVEDRFSLQHAARIQAEVYAAALAHRRSRRDVARGDAAAVLRYARYEAARQWRRRRGREQVDDFNARPVLAPSTAGPGAAAGART